MSSTLRTLIKKYEKRIATLESTKNQETGTGPSAAKLHAALEANAEIEALKQVIEDLKKAEKQIDDDMNMAALHGGN